MLKVAVGHSDDPDSESAACEVVEQCLRSLAGETPKAGLLLAAIDFDHSLILDYIHQTFPDIELIGGTTDGEISSVLEFQQDSLTLMVFCSDQIDICAGVGRRVSENPVAATQHAIAQVMEKSSAPPQLCLTIPESLTISGVSMVEGLRLALGPSVPIFGGLAGDQRRLQTTYQFFQADVLSDAVPVLLFSGELLFSHGVESGWHPIGKKSRVTKVDKNIVYEIDHKPALDFYHHYLGKISPSGEYPLAVFEADEERFYMRAPSGYDRESGCITFFADVPEQALVQITEASREEVLAAARASFMQAMDSYPGKEPEAALFFSCAARRKLLGTRTKEEYQRIKTDLPRVLPSCGFYSYGEISPLKPNSQTQFHNETFVTLLLGSR